MDGTVREYERILTELQDMLFETNEDYKALRKEFETVRSDFDSIETRERSKQLLLLQKKIKAYSWRIRHVESQLAYIAKVSGRMLPGRTLFKRMWFPGARHRIWQPS